MITPSITQRLRRLHQRMTLERVSGIPAADKAAFLAFCREHEAATMQTGDESSAITWSTFGDWHNSPVFSFDRSK